MYYGYFSAVLRFEIARWKYSGTQITGSRLSSNPQYPATILAGYWSSRLSKRPDIESWIKAAGYRDFTVAVMQKYLIFIDSFLYELQIKCAYETNTKMEPDTYYSTITDNPQKTNI